MASHTPPMMHSLQPLVDMSYESFMHESASAATSHDGCQNYPLTMPQHLDMAPFSPSFLDHELDMTASRIRSSPDAVRNQCTDAVCELDAHQQCQTMSSSDVFFGNENASQHLFGSVSLQQGFVDKCTTGSSTPTPCNSAAVDRTHSFAQEFQRSVQYFQQQQQAQHDLELRSRQSETGDEQEQAVSCGAECPGEVLQQAMKGSGSACEPTSTQSDDTVEQRKADLPPPPKKPLSPYMRFSKAVSCILN